jgi:hypothetical protein
MPALRPIGHLIYDPIDDGRPSLEDRDRLRQREHPRRVAAPALVSNPLGNALAGFKARGGGGTLKGGTFAPRARSGML